MAKSDNGPSPIWAVTQQSASCGMVWFNQNQGAMSEYTILEILGSEDCVESGHTAWAGVFEMEVWRPLLLFQLFGYFHLINIIVIS